MGNDFVVIRGKATGPIPDGAAGVVLREWQNATGDLLASIGSDRIKYRADLMDKSGRGGTGRAAAHVSTSNWTGGWVITGRSEEGETWWPWLEGTSKRNFTTRFKGYHTFRVVKNQLQRMAGKIGRAVLDDFIGRLN